MVYPLPALMSIDILLKSKALKKVFVVMGPLAL